MEVRSERRMLDDQFERRSWYEGRRLLESRWAGPMSHDSNQQAENSHLPATLAVMKSSDSGANTLPGESPGASPRRSKRGAGERRTDVVAQVRAEGGGLSER